MAEKLKDYFPMIREKEELLSEIRDNPYLKQTYDKLSNDLQQEFLEFCTGMRGIKILYDSFFKEVMNPEYDSRRLEDLLCVMLEKKVRIVRILPNDSTRIADETSLLISDIIVELEDGALANVEIQKIGYAFPGPRSACYSADMLLRQYKRVRAQKGKHFAYSQIKSVYLIIIYENSPKEFQKFPDYYYHHSKQIFDSGLQLDLLQEYIMIPLDIYHKRVDNKNIENKLEAWLTFLSDDRPERIIELITKYPEFKPMYETLYQMCLNVERVMDMFFSEELRILDRNTVLYMMDEQQKEIEERQKKLTEQQEALEEQREALEEQQEALEEQQEALEEQREALEEQREALEEQREEIEEQREIISQQNEEIIRLKLEIDKLKKNI